MDIFAQFATDPKLELEGVWTEIGPRKDENDPLSAPAILVARDNNRRYGRILSSLYESNKTLLESKGDAAEERGEQITIDAMAQGILLDFRNLEFKGDALSYSLANAKTLLGVKDFRALVQQTSKNFQKYKLLQEAEDAKK